MEMGVDVGVLVGVDQIAVPMGVGVDVGMGVDMLKRDAVPDHQNGAGRHNGQGGVKAEAGPLPQEKGAME